MAEMQMQCLKKALKTCLENCALTSLAHCSSAKLSTEQCASSDDGGVIKTSTKFHQGFWPLCVFSATAFASLFGGYITGLSSRQIQRSKLHFDGISIGFQRALFLSLELFSPFFHDFDA